MTTLAVVVTDWYIHVRGRNTFRSAPHSLWDTLFTRHQQEREELLRWEDRLSHHSLNLETICDAAVTPVPRPSRLPDGSDSEDETTSESGSALIEWPERKPFEIEINKEGRYSRASGVYDASGSEYESECAFGGPPKNFQSRAEDRSAATVSALSPAVDIGIDFLPCQKPSLTGQTSSSIGLGDYQNLPISIFGEDALASLHNQSHSPNLNPESNVNSVATSPPLEFDSEFELEDGGCTTSSSTSLSPAGWELVNYDDVRPNLHSAVGVLL